MNKKNNIHLQRLPSLDGLRAFAILLVCIGHTAGTINAPEFLLPLHSLGNFGVKIFFVISGFIITYLLLIEHERKKHINLKQFYIRRSLRIFPAFYFFILCIAIAHFRGWIELWEGDLLHASTYTMNYHHERSWWLNHTWSLAVEEQFYLLWPLLLLIKGKHRGYKIALFTICAIPIIRAFMWFVLESHPSAMTREFQAVADALATGCILAYIYKSESTLPKWFHSIWFYCIPMCMLLLPAAIKIIHPPTFYIIGQSITNICAAALIWRVLIIQKGLTFKILNYAPIMWLGSLSYSLYLWQEPFLNSWVREWYATWPTNLLLTFICALLSYYIIEKPVLKIRDKIKKKDNKKRPEGRLKLSSK